MNDAARRAAPGAWFNLIIIVILAAATNYSAAHPRVFYSVLIAHVALTLIRLWLIGASTGIFASRLETWRNLLCACIVASGIVWGAFGAVTNYVYTNNTVETLLVTISVLGITASILTVLAAELIALRIFLVTALMPARPDSHAWVPQLGSADCGLAALAMVGRRLGLPMSVEGLRRKASPGPEGLSLRELRSLAAEGGLAAPRAANDAGR